MKVTEITTDSLYKFFTIAGLFLVTFSFTYINDKRNESLFEIRNINKEMEISFISLKELREEMKKQDKNFAELDLYGQKQKQKLKELDKISTITEPEKKNSKVQEFQNELKNLMKELNQIDEKRERLNESFNKKSFEWEKEQIEIKYKQENYDFKKGELLLLTILLYGGQIIGVFLLIFGLDKWIKIQNIQDEILNYQLQILKKENPDLLKDKKKMSFKNKEKK